MESVGGITNILVTSMFIFLIHFMRAQWTKCIIKDIDPNNNSTDNNVINEIMTRVSYDGIYSLYEHVH